jgi:hypothetical protein
MPTSGPVAPRPRRTRRRGQRALCLSALVVALAASASAQLVPVRTLPLAQGDQFLIFPSHTLGMGGVSIALADSLLDPFRNPAMGARVGATRLFSSPAFYSISRESGAGRTLPFASLLRAGRWFGGVSVAIQEVETSRPFQVPPIIFARGTSITQTIPGLGPAQQTRGNGYAFASLGKVVTGSGLSLGGSALWSRLQVIDGVALLYPGSDRVSQSGHGLDLRLGLLQEAREPLARSTRAAPPFRHDAGRRLPRPVLGPGHPAVHSGPTGGAQPRSRHHVGDARRLPAPAHCVWMADRLARDRQSPVSAAHP